MSADWRFEPKIRSQKSRDPMQASFFTNASIDDDTHALVREAIQNSLDANVDRNSDQPVKVRFSIGTHASNNNMMKRYISPEAWLHFNAEDNGLREPPNSSDECRFLVYEDFNTQGLIGDETAVEAEKGNAFYYFMRAEGQSGKEEGERGRHGIGKFVFPYTSRIRMFIAATVRSSDMRCFIAGQSVLKSHHVDSKAYTPDGWWGRFESDGFQLPVESTQWLEQLVQDFGLARDKSKTGLSIVMPYVQEEVTANKLAEHVIREYFWPILNGQLIVEVAEAGEEKTIEASTIDSDLDKLLPADQAERIKPYIRLASGALSKNTENVVELKLSDKPSMPKWDKDYLSKTDAEAINKALSSSDPIVSIKCPLYIQPNQSRVDASSSYFTILISKNLTEADVARKPLFVREGITIPEDRVPSVRGNTAIVVIERGSLATLLGDSENPAHTEWEKNATKFKGKYRWGPTTIDFVRLSVRNMLNLLSQSDEEEDLTLLSDIFYVDLPENDEEVPASRKRKKRKETGPEVEPGIEPPPPPRPRSYRLSKVDNGFVVQGPTEPMLTTRRYKVTVAYDFSGASKAQAIKKYHKNDFDISKSKNVNKPFEHNLKDVDMKGNTVAFLAENSDFRLEITGFDPRRDIIVDVQSEAVADETI